MDEALEECPGVSALVFKRTGANVPWTSGRDLWWHEEVDKWYGALKHKAFVRVMSANIQATSQALLLPPREHEFGRSNVSPLYFWIHWKAEGSYAHNCWYGTKHRVALLYAM